MYLPNELVEAILGHLDRSHLKSTRLVCKTWCLYASRFLFDKIYVAPNRIDIEVFEAITQHPILSEFVRRLVYDGSEFVPDLTMCNYVWSLESQMTLMGKTGEASLENLDSQTRDWVTDPIRHRIPLPEVGAKGKDQSLIDRGYRVYQQHSVYQQRVLQSGEFIESLVQGLSRLVCLESVALEGGWRSAVRENLGEHHHGTPLARRWNPYHCCPHKWSWEPEESDVENSPTGERHYWIITTALVRAQRHVDEFVFNGDCLLRWDGLSPRFSVLNALGLDIAALSGIKRLHLLLASCGDAEAPEYCDDNIGGLPKLLGSMHSLHRLELDLPNAFDPLILYNHDQVFPKVMMWNNLQRLGLFNFASSATNLLRLLLIQMPRLRILELSFTRLLEGCWESVIECLKQCNQFTSLEINQNCFLYHHGEVLDCDNADISEYVMLGGRHPCLSKNQPTSASEAYMLRIDASLRDRLREMKSSRTNVPI